VTSAIGPSGQPRLEKAPFRLSAIVNRLDLRTFRPENEPLGGEVRFVFAGTGSETSACPPSPLEQSPPTERRSCSVFLIE
jgi:hypothetical protein